ncbi:zinc finger protein 287-like [Topomyia yanbarensis]|uniref:zinc finger protein 287-like n=1 Tax=Topomyia yanbarensis TaxID=2498891 RepID=UPI00273BCEF1|nr:zinc finger protein 287-like [Topomyia yanbarensis]XP_058820242.1 zinc finger protein 287-like [Topomyia yanbarensis]XP_058820243.1 zinc finger protein 287-like [Topomyia yanbarensis]
MDTSDICRVCMDDDGDNFTSLYEESEGFPLTPAEMISNCAGIEVERDDGLPGVICNECLRAINEAHLIRSKCRNTDRKLRKILNLRNKLNVKSTIENSSKNLSPIIERERLPAVLETSPCEEVGKESISREYLSDRKPLVDNDFIEKELADAIPGESQHTCKDQLRQLEVIKTSLILVKQEDMQQGAAALEEEYLIEELKEFTDEDVNSETEPSNTSAKVFEKEELLQNPSLDGAKDNSGLETETFVKMEVQTLEEDEYEDYEAIDEESEAGEFGEVSQSNDIASCCGCPMEFATVEELVNHSKSTHLTNKNENTLQEWFSCEICYKKHSSQKALDYHKTYQRNKKMRTCVYCKLILHSVRKRKQHEQLHKTLPEDYEINCCGCDQMVPLKQLGIHSEQFHKKTNQVFNSKFVCDVCFLDCGFKHRLEYHQSKQELPKVTKNVERHSHSDKVFEAPTADIDGRQRFICDICEKHFSTKGNLKSHHSLHATTEKPFKCIHCEKDFSKKSNFNVHMLRAHSNDSAFRCTMCSKRFKCATNLKTHMRVHTKERPYSCTFCPKRFAHLSDKRRHEIVHSGNYPYRCNLCNKPFTRKTVSERHQEICNKRLESNKTARDQKVSRQLDNKTQYSNAVTTICDICDERFMSVVDLTNHHVERHAQTLHDGTYEAEVEIE